MSSADNEVLAPRIAPLQPDELSAEQEAVLSSAIVNDKGVLRPRRSGDSFLPFVGIMLRHPGLYAQFNPLGNFILQKGRLSARDRELVTLRVGWLCKTPFQWAHHVRIAHQLGMKPEDLERITAGPSAPGWTERDRALLAAVDELHSSSTLSDKGWSELQPHFDEQQLIELIFAVGFYHLMSITLNGLRIHPDPSLRGLEAR
jgi:4-carboxymuconolactone decarboxylase